MKTTNELIKLWNEYREWREKENLNWNRDNKYNMVNVFESRMTFKDFIYWIETRLKVK